MAYSYGATPVLSGIDMHVNAGEFVALVGPNGSGKSTLLKTVLGLLTPQSGSVRLLGDPSGKSKQPWKVGYVPQRHFVDSDIPATVEEVVASGRLGRQRWWKRAGLADKAAIDAAIDAVGIADLRRKRLSRLSGGQQQRVQIAKALTSEPSVLILDEPVAGVDAASQRQFRDTLVRLKNQGTAVLLVSHELAAVANDLDRIVVMRRGGVEFDGTPLDLAGRGVNLGVHASDLPVWLEDL